VDWLVRMTGRVGFPHSMVPEVEFFACARVISAELAKYINCEVPSSLGFLFITLPHPFLPKNQRDIDMVSPPLSKKHARAMQHGGAFAVRTQNIDTHTSWTLPSGYRNELQSLAWFSASRSPEMPRGLYHDCLLSSSSSSSSTHTTIRLFDFENKTAGVHGLSLYTPHHDIARCSCPKTKFLKTMGRAFTHLTTTWRGVPAQPRQR